MIFPGNRLDKLLKFHLNNVVKTSSTSKESIVPCAKRFKTNSETPNIDLNFSKNLKHLNIKDCSLKNYDFVNLLFQISSLESLILSNNNLNFDRCTLIESNLKRLEVSNCKIDNDLSFFNLTNFPKLEVLDISKNNFQNINIGFTLGRSKDSLIELDCSDCKFLNIGFGLFCDCSKLQKLNISKNHNFLIFLTESCDIGNLKNTLTEINISECSFNYKILKVLADCSNLKKLNISYNPLGSIPLNFDFCGLKSSLAELDITNCNLNKSMISLFTDFPQLQKLSAAYNEREIDDILELGCSKNSLLYLDLRFCNLKINDLREITRCSRIRNLYLSGGCFMNLPESFAFNNLVNSVTHLEMSTCGLNSNGLKSLTKFLKLKELIVSGNSFDLSNFDFSNLKKTLIKLDLANCQLNIKDLKSLVKFSHLNCLNLSKNDFSELPSDFKFGNLIRTLTTLQLVDCLIDDNLWTQVTSFNKLQNLSLSRISLNNDNLQLNFGKLERTLNSIDLLGYNYIDSDLVCALNKCSKLSKIRVNTNFIFNTDLNTNVSVEIIDPEKYTS